MTLSPRKCYTREKHGYKSLPWAQESSRYTLGFRLYLWLLVWDVLRPCRGAPVETHETLLDCIFGATGCMNEARSFVTELQDKAILVEDIMCNAEIERCRLVTVAG